MGSSSHSNILAIPFIWPGHVAPLLHLCKALAASGSRVTLLKVPDEAEAVGSVRYDAEVKIVSALPLSPSKLPPAARGGDQSQDMEVILDYFKRFHSLDDDGTALDVVKNLEADEPFTCIISDVYVGWARGVANKLGIPWIAFWTSTVAELVVYYHMPELISKRIFPFAGPPSNELFRIPGLPDLRPDDYPIFGYIEEPALHTVLHTFKEMVQKITESKVLLVNSIYELETGPIYTLRKNNINVQSVGPLHRLSEELGSNDDGKTGDNTVIKWLDDKPKASVLYIAFGTTMPVMESQFTELALALEDYGCSFIWAVRQMSLLPEGFASRVATSNKGLLVSFAPQIAVLEHSAIGGFFTHCGWNSVLESMSLGVPMIARPISGDQVLTKRFLVDEWGIALGLEGGSYLGVADRHQIKSAIELLLGSNPTAEVLKKKVSRVKDIVSHAVSLDGSSRNGMSRLCAYI